MCWQNCGKYCIMISIVRHKGGKDIVKPECQGRKRIHKGLMAIESGIIATAVILSPDSRHSTMIWKAERLKITLLCRFLITQKDFGREGRYDFFRKTTFTA